MTKATKAPKAPKTPKAGPMATAIEQGAMIPDTAPTEAPAPIEEEAAEIPTESASEAAEAPTEEPAPEVITVETEAPKLNEEEQSIIDAETKYGHDRLKDILVDLDTFVEELRGGVEPAVARAIFAGLLKVPAKHSVASTPKVPKSTCENPTRRVWDIADEAMNRLDAIPSRQEVVTLAIEAGVSTGTARTQFQCWYSARKPEFVKKGWLK